MSMLACAPEQKEELRAKGASSAKKDVGGDVDAFLAQTAKEIDTQVRAPCYIVRRYHLSMAYVY